MGCRTRANEYYAMMSQTNAQQNRRHAEVVEGNVVRKSVPQKAAPVRIRRKKKRTASVSAAKALGRQKARFVALGIAASAAIISLCAVMLMTLQESSTLADEVALKEAQLEELTVANDARKYEIDSSVDLNYVITVATEELGMVRSSLSQVVTYSTKDTEYLQQVAKVPAD